MTGSRKADMKRGVIFTGGEIPAPAFIGEELHGADIIIGADSGAETAIDAGILPDFIIGDFDSIRSPATLDRFPKERILRYPADKDQTDTELAIDLARSKGCDEVVIIGGGGGRLDHVIGILTLLEREYPPRRVYMGRYVLTVIDRYCTVERWNGKILSFFPLGTTPCRARTNGLQWELTGLIWRKGDMGLSNMAVADPVQIEILSGRLLMVKELFGE